MTAPRTLGPEPWPAVVCLLALALALAVVAWARAEDRANDCRAERHGESR